MLILVIIDVQHSQKAVFSFEKGSYCQNHSSGFLRSITPTHPNPYPLLLFGKPWGLGTQVAVKNEQLQDKSHYHDS